MLDFKAPSAFGEKVRKPAATRTLAQSKNTAKWLTHQDELLRIVLDPAPWEDIKSNYEAATSTGEDPIEDESPEQRMQSRCTREIARPPFHWFPVSMETVKNGYDKVAPGMFFGLEFPWTEAMLAEFGPKWLTKAFRAAGTLPKNNRVTKLITRNRTKVTGGNNAVKFLFEVQYAREDQGLHTHLFAKCPFAMNGPNQTDRFSSSVYKQPMDMLELNTYRLMEAALPFKTPRFYYGDISNETTNFILITERVPFSEHDGPKKSLAPFEVEGPFDKCKDFNLREPHSDYYLTMVKKQALIAAKWKTGGLPPIFQDPPTDPGSYGANPLKATGENPGSCRIKLDAAIKFMSETAKALFPNYVCTPEFQDKFKDTMMKVNAYSAEINYFKNCDSDYTAVGHMNLNVDNAYFWRDEQGNLDCGVFDFGGFGSSSLPHKLWWMLNMAEFENIQENLDLYIDAFIRDYKAFGGPQLDRDIFRITVLVVALQNCMIMVSALPNALKQCPTKEWLTIKDRHDPRIADNVDNKSTLRTNIHVLNVTVRVMEELAGAEAVDWWISDIWIGKYFQVAKSETLIYDTSGHTETTRWG